MCFSFDLRLLDALLNCRSWVYCWPFSNAAGLIRKLRDFSNPDEDTLEESEELGSSACCPYPASFLSFFFPLQTSFLCFSSPSINKPSFWQFWTLQLKSKTQKDVGSSVSVLVLAHPLFQCQNSSGLALISLTLVRCHSLRQWSGGPRENRVSEK